MKETALHFCRLRHKDSKEPFMDPTADIVEVVHQAFKEIPVFFKDVLQEEDIDYLKSITKVLITRLEEDTAPLDEQFNDFLEAFNKLDKKQVIIGYFALYIFSRYMLQHRRDGIVDKKDRELIRASSALMSLMLSVNEDTYKEIKKEISDKIVKYIEEPIQTVTTVDAVCIEDEDKNIEDIKDIAAAAVGATGSTKWSDVAAACDKYVTETKSTTDKDIAVALAYPDYKCPYFELGVTNE